MQVIDARTLVRTSLEQLAEDLGRGRSEKLTAFLDAMSRFHKYSWGNTMLILSQCPHATQVAGFRQWNRLGRCVRRGERGLSILAPIVVRAREDAGAPDDAVTRERGERGETQLRFKRVCVFDISQTDGEPLPELDEVRGDPGTSLERLTSFIAERGIELERCGMPGSALGVSRGGRIQIREGLAPAQEFEVLAHELAHEMLHHGPDRGSFPVSVRELEAEAVAYVVCRHAGLEPGDACRDYILAHGGDPGALAASLDRIQHTASVIVEAVMSATTLVTT